MEKQTLQQPIQADPVNKQSYFSYLDGLFGQFNQSKIRFLFVVLAIIIAGLFLLYKPMIQDDAWATSFVVSKIKTGDPFKNGVIDAFDQLSYRTYYNWFNFIPLELSVRSFGVNLIGARFHIWIYSILLFFAIPFYLNSVFKIRTAYLLPLLFVFLPDFNLHFWNRSEIPALFFSLTAIYLINSKAKHATFLSILFFLISFDIHATSAFLAFPFIVFKLKLNQLRCWIEIGLAGLTGSLIIISSKLQFYSFAENNLDFILKCLHLKGGSDHYTPLFYLSSHDFYETEKIRLYPFIKTFSPVLVLFLLNIRKIFSQPQGVYFFKAFISNIILSILLIDTVANGYQLYMLICFLIFTVYVFVFTDRTWVNTIFTAVFLVVLTVNAKDSSKSLISNIKDKPIADRYYEKVERIIREGNYEKIGCRPQYFFITNKLNKKLDFYFSIFLDANRKKTNILEELEAKKYDIFIYDNGFEQTIISEEKNAPGMSWSAYYAALPSVPKKTYESYLNDHYTLILTEKDPLGLTVKFYSRKK